MSLSRFFETKPNAANNKRPREVGSVLDADADADDQVPHTAAAAAAAAAAVNNENQFLSNEGKSTRDDTNGLNHCSIKSRRGESQEGEHAVAGGIEDSDRIVQCEEVASEEGPDNSQPNKTGEEKKVRVNPFAKFAFGALAVTLEANPANGKRFEAKMQKTKTAATNSSSKFTATATTCHKTKKRKASSEPRKWIPMKELAVDEQKRVEDKWHALIACTCDNDNNIEDDRFRMLVSALLHARCQEPVVRKALDDLRRKFQCLSVDNVANLDPQAIAAEIKSLQYHNSKARYIVLAAKEIQTRFRGVVPEDERALKEITGIGPVFADLLATVNTRAVHKARRPPQV